MPLKITIELIPHGDILRKSKVAVIGIVNDRTGNELVGNYYVHAEGNLVQGWDLFFQGKVTGVRRMKNNQVDYLFQSAQILDIISRSGKVVE